MFAFWTARDRATPLPCTAVPVSPVAAVGEPTSLLSHVAGEFAARVAGLWPAPHAAFLTAPAERRHLICLAFACARGAGLPVSTAGLLDLSAREVAARCLAAPPEGLRRALAHMGETAWAAEDYERLLYVLAQGAAAKQLRHAELLAPERVRALAALPTPLLKARVGGFGLKLAEARLLRDGFALVVRQHGQEAAGRAVLRWAGARSAKALFEMVEDDVLPPMPPAPFASTFRLRHISTKAEMRQTAARYRNCLRTRMATVCRGEAAVYEWMEAPCAIIELVRDDYFGWRLNEARLVRNATVPLAARERIVAELRAQGVHVGRTGWQIQNALEDAQDGACWYDEDEGDVAWMFGA
jgi:hypothetical protein